VEPGSSSPSRTHLQASVIEMVVARVARIRGSKSIVLVGVGGLI
jgi:hypothetical protein